MTTALHLWFVMSGFDDESSDTSEVARLTGIGNDLLSITDVHLSLLANREKPDPTETVLYNQWEILTAQMAAEMYQKSGMHGVRAKASVGGSLTFSEEYSKPVMKMIYSFKRLHYTT